MKVIIVKNYDEMSAKAASLINQQIIDKPNSVLGLATGGTPLKVYNFLVEAYKSGETDWSSISTFNLDEYAFIPQKHPISYYTYMHDNLFSHVNVNSKNVHLPFNQGDLNKNGKEYDALIAKSGGIDLQLLGIGENGHIAFNEPGSSFEACTREVELTESTRKANSRYFKSLNDVPKKAISMGIGSIMKAKKILLLASGKNKQDAIKKTIEDKINSQVPASILQKHNDVVLIIDQAAAKLLKNNSQKYFFIKNNEK